MTALTTNYRQVKCQPVSLRGPIAWDDAIHALRVRGVKRLALLC